MRITKVRVFPINEDKLKAFATIIIDECFLVRDLKIIQGPRGKFVAMPSKRRKDGKYEEMAHPLNANTRAQIEDAIFNEYHRVIGKRDADKEKGAEGKSSETTPSAEDDDEKEIQ